MKLLALVLLLTGCNLYFGNDGPHPSSDASIDAPVDAAILGNIVLTSGNFQNGTACAPLAEPLVVTVEDTNGAPLEGVTVTFSVTGGGGSLSAETAVTDAQGQARTTLTLGVAGTNAVQARAAGFAGSPIDFFAIAAIGPASQLVLVDGDGQAMYPEETLPMQLRVVVEDACGDLVAGTPVTFAVTTGGGTISPLTTMTDQFGGAAASWTVGTDEVETAEAAAPGLVGSPIVFTAAVFDFASHVNFPTGSLEARAGTFVDVNGDGKPDLVVASSVSNTVSVLLNTTATGATTPSFAPKVEFATGANPQSIAVCDVNSDGKPDIAVANESASTVSVLLNSTSTGATTPVLATHADFATGAQPWFVACGDLDGDGKPDLAVGITSNNTVSVLRGTTTTGAATASFATKLDFGTGAFPSAVSISDVNGDGRADLVVANTSGESVSVLLNTTAMGAMPSFAAKVDVTTGDGTSTPWSIAMGDLDGDGKPDLVVANDEYNFVDVSVLLNTTPTGATTPSFSAFASFPAASGSVAVALGDFNGDGKLDLAVADDSENSPGNPDCLVSILINTTAAGASAPSFANELLFITGPGPLAIDVADVNGDGKADLATTSFSTDPMVAPSVVSVLLHE